MSLRTRLLIAIGVIALAALTIADIATYRYLESYLFQQADQQLEAAHRPFESRANQGLSITPCTASNVFTPQHGEDNTTTPLPGPSAGPPSNVTGALAVEVRSPNGGVINGQTCSAYVDGSPYLPQIPTTITGFSSGEDGTQVAYFDAPATKSGGPVFRVRASTLRSGDLLIVAQPVTEPVDTLHHLLVVELAVTAGAVLIALAGGFWLVRIGLRPLRDMETTAEAIAAGNLTERVPGQNETTEVGRLARTLNVMLARIESAFSARLASERRLRASEARLRRFVADASHELRTPIAAISAYAELFGRGASEQKEDLERLMGGIRTETTRMEQLVADLLLLARLDEGRPMERRSVDLVSLCAEAVHTASTVGPDWPLSFHASQPIEVEGDATSLRQVIDNLLGNVRAHTPPGTGASVSVEPDGEGAVITVSDSGPGMDPDQAAHIFERFYRSDPSRSRAHGGAGLGLSIVSAIVANHGGTVSASSRPGQGTTFTVHLPPAPPPESEAEGDGGAAPGGVSAKEPDTSDLDLTLPDEPPGA